MSLTLDRLKSHCQQPLQPLYVISGDELYLTDQAVKTLSKAASHQGYTECQRFHADNLTDWPAVWQAVHTQSLFSPKKMILVRSNTKAMTKPIHQQFIAYADNPHTDVLLILVLPKLTAPQKKQAWLQAVERVGHLVTIWPISRDQLPAWITQRVHQYDMDITPQASLWLSEQVEGESSLAAQEIEKLYCLYALAPENHDTKITLTEEHLRDMVIDASRFNVYDLVDSCLNADAKRSLRILNTLRAEGAELILLNWAIPRVCRQLLALHAAPAHDFQQVCKMQGIWPKQQRLFQQALTRLSPQQCQQTLVACQWVDECIKGLRREDPWQHLQQICLSLCGLSILKVG